MHCSWYQIQQGTLVCWMQLKSTKEIVEVETISWHTGEKCVFRNREYSLTNADELEELRVLKGGAKALSRKRFMEAKKKYFLSYKNGISAGNPPLIGKEIILQKVLHFNKQNVIKDK